VKHPDPSPFRSFGWSPDVSFFAHSEKIFSND
jgi:hypothetical protein